jgi:hypothetical protein
VQATRNVVFNSNKPETKIASLTATSTVRSDETTEKHNVSGGSLDFELTWTHGNGETATITRNSRWQTQPAYMLPKHWRAMSSA